MLPWQVRSEVRRLFHQLNGTFRLNGLLLYRRDLGCLAYLKLLHRMLSFAHCQTPYGFNMATHLCERPCFFYNVAPYFRFTLGNKVSVKISCVYSFPNIQNNLPWIFPCFMPVPIDSLRKPGSECRPKLMDIFSRPNNGCTVWNHSLSLRHIQG